MPSGNLPFWRSGVFLVPISGSAYTRDVFADMYAPPFFHSIAVELDRDKDSSLSPFETFGSWAVGDWSFEDEQIRAYFETLREIASHFPRGFLGLDRETGKPPLHHAQCRHAPHRRMGDASSIFSLARDQAEPFDVGVRSASRSRSGRTFLRVRQPASPAKLRKPSVFPWHFYKLSENEGGGTGFPPFPHKL